VYTFLGEAYACVGATSEKRSLPLGRLDTPVIERTHNSLRKSASYTTARILFMWRCRAMKHRRTRFKYPFLAIRIRFVFVAGGSQHKKKTPKNHDKPLRYVKMMSLLVHYGAL
jgi:hypothetical protein